MAKPTSHRDVQDAYGKLGVKLSEPERIIITRRWGIDGEPCTLGLLAEEMGISRERVRQIENRALGKLGYRV